MACPQEIKYLNVLILIIYRGRGQQTSGDIIVTEKQLDVISLSALFFI